MVVVLRRPLFHALACMIIVPVGAWLPSIRTMVSTNRIYTSRATLGSIAATEDSQPKERRPPAVYQLLSTEQIDNIHTVADALFDVLDRNGDEQISIDELGVHLLLASERMSCHERLGLVEHGQGRLGRA